MPNISDKTENEIFWINFAEELAMLREKERQKLPYNFNIIDELHANENANTRILIKLLKYNTSGEYKLLKSFISMMCSNNYGTTFPISKICKPQITFNRENIDGLIEEPGKQYAIIIENKINWAADQDRQLERYFNTVKDHGVPKENIYVIYLTLEGSKKVSASSMPDWLKAELENGNRFIEMNYRDDILPWLRDDILPEIQIKEHLIESGIRQYIDYLEGRLNLRKTEKQIRSAMNRTIKEKLLKDKSICEQWRILNNSIKNVEELQTDLHNTSDNIAIPVINQWDKITRMHFGDANTHNALRNGYYQIFLTDINQNIHFEWCPISEKDLFEENCYRMVLHVEVDNNNVNMLRLSRIDDLCKTAEEFKYNISFDEGKGVDAISKKYYTTEKKPFADLGETDRERFLENCYHEVDVLKEIIENSFHKFDKENEIIENLRHSMQKITGYTWKRWPDNDNAWDIVASFNQNSNAIGIEGFFAITNNEIVFRWKITVWETSVWDIYEQQLLNKYQCHPEKKDNRVNLYLPDIIIGPDLQCWEAKEQDVISQLKETFDYMLQLTSKTENNQLEQTK